MYQRTIDVGAAMVDSSACAKGDRQYQWVVTLEPSINIEVDELPVVPKGVFDRSGVRGFVEGDQGSERFEDRSTVVEGKRSPRLLIPRQ